MQESRDPQSLSDEIGQFIRSARQPVLIEDDVALFDLSVSQWRVASEFGKLVLEVWNQGRSMVRRVEGLAYRDQGRLGLFVRKPHGREIKTLEIREAGVKPGVNHQARDRAEFRRELLAALAQEWRGWKFEQVSNRSDREHSLSAWYTRGLARKGREGWAFLGLNAAESPAAADSILAFGLLWLDGLRHRSRGPVISGLKLFLPRQAADLNARRLEHLNSRAVRPEFYLWQPGDSAPEPFGLGASGEMGVRLAPRALGLALLERHRPLLQELLGPLTGQVEIIPDSGEKCLSLRVSGLELARVEGDLAPRVLFGLEGRVRQLDRSSHDELRDFIRTGIERRRAANPDRSDDLYRLQAERWLESLVVRDVTRLDPALRPEFVYSQVPAFSNVNRGVIDVLGIRSDHRLAVIELKLHEEINLPFQALDYWIAVKQLAETLQFQRFGYFQDFAPSTSPPVLYLVAPAFRFHSSTNHLLRYFDPSIETVLVGINDSWRKEFKILFRRQVRGP